MSFFILWIQVASQKRLWAIFFCRKLFFFMEKFFSVMFMQKIKNFVETWKNRGYEKGETQKFWLAFLRDVLKISEPEKIINFEVPVKLAHTNFIDVFFPDTKVIVEQKSLSENFSPLKPFEQAQKYISGLPLSLHPRKIIVCNFAEFFIYDMETLAEPEKILLSELPEKFHAFDFLIDANKTKIRIELELSLQAGEIVAKLYDALHAQYFNPNSAESLQSLNKLCVRLVFCLYAESAGIFGKHKIFRDYLQTSRNIRRDLLDLFEVLNTPTDQRNFYLADELKIFPYVNGGLFAEKNIEIPNFTPEIKNLLLDEASSGFNWAGISPTIFGAVFESTLNPETRRAGGMHYTSIENIHKVIDNLFLDNLHEEFLSCKKNRRKLLALQNKLAGLKFFDPACGSGNFLTESYISLRRLENDILKELLGEKILLGDFSNPVKISINQFFGIEINDFAVSVAQTALWIAELQMAQETSEIIHRQLNFLPLKNFANIFEGNALQVDWQKICPNPDFIMGNPPFVGASMMTATQKSDAVNIFGKIKLSNSIDYVGAWYHKAAKFIANTKIKAAFVSTNSITQGEQVAPLWKKIFADYHVQIIFAFRTFRWDSESTDKAHVHCVIIGIADQNISTNKKIFDGNKVFSAENINPYLQDAPTVFIESRSKTISKNILQMTRGNMPVDDGNFILSEVEAENFAKKYPQHKKFLHRYLGAKDFLHGEPVRFCLWLKDIPPNEYSNNREIMRRLNAIKNFREKSSAAPTRKSAETPYKFFSTPQKNSCIVIPRVSSERRQYIPMDFISAEIIASDSLSIIPDAEIYHFGVLESSVHMAWVRVVAGRLESRLRYSGSVVYNNFIWCEPTENQRKKIEQSAQEILDCRKNYPDSTLADLYDPTLMPKDLRDAHKKNDRAVLAAYGFDKNFSEYEIVSELMKLYQDKILTCNLNPQDKKRHQSNLV